MTAGSRRAAYDEDEAWATLKKVEQALAAEGRRLTDIRVYLTLGVMPDVDTYKRFEDAGVSDLICAPWMLAERSDAKDYRSSLDAKLAATEQFANDIIARMA